MGGDNEVGSASKSIVDCFSLLSLLKSVKSLRSQAGGYCVPVAVHSIITLKKGARPG